uniref:Uncharacterized protein n=1 Tax=Panagrolaimus davidi TaxID=227884 RepID=A0A914P022_9BILA
MSIQHKKEIFDSFFNSPESFILFETHDINFLQTLVNDENIRKCDKTPLRKFINNALLINKSKTQPIKTAPVKYNKTKNSGFYFSKNSLQFLTKPTKKAVYNFGGYSNIDIVNCGYTVLYQICISNGIELPTMKEFIENREKICAEHPPISEKYTVKQHFCAILSKSEHSEGESEFIKKLVDELIFVRKLLQHPEFPDFSAEKIIGIYTNFIMKLIVEYLVTNEIIVPNFYSLNCDEIYFKPLKEFKIADVEKFIFEKTGFLIKMH